MWSVWIVDHAKWTECVACVLALNDFTRHALVFFTVLGPGGTILVQISELINTVGASISVDADTILSDEVLSTSTVDIISNTDSTLDFKLDWIHVTCGTCSLTLFICHFCCSNLGTHLASYSYVARYFLI